MNAKDGCYPGYWLEFSKPLELKSEYLILLKRGWCMPKCLAVAFIAISLVMGVLIWRNSAQPINASLVPTVSALSTLSGISHEMSEEEITHTEPQTENSVAGMGHYESIEETISRLRKDVLVTGTTMSIPGEESAIVQIEGLSERIFKINTQLMDGFIIEKITSRRVLLKNQSGEETISLIVGRFSEGRFD